MATKNEQNDPIEKVHEAFDNRPRNNEDVSREIEIRKKDRANLIVKSYDWYKNDANIWNNVHRTNKKHYGQYYQKWDKDQIDFNKNQKILEDRNREQKKSDMKQFVLLNKEVTNNQDENIKLERLLLQKESNQKILEKGIEDKIFDEINELNTNQEKKRILTRSSVQNRIQSKNLWEIKKYEFDSKHLKMDLTEKVLEGEKNAVDNIIKRWKKEKNIENLSEQLLQNKQESIRQSYCNIKNNNELAKGKVTYPPQRSESCHKLRNLTNNNRMKNGEIQPNDTVITQDYTARACLTSGPNGMSRPISQGAFSLKNKTQYVSATDKFPKEQAPEFNKSLGSRNFPGTQDEINTGNNRLTQNTSPIRIHNVIVNVDSKDATRPCSSVLTHLVNQNRTVNFRRGCIEDEKYQSQLTNANDQVEMPNRNKDRDSYIHQKPKDIYTKSGVNNDQKLSQANFNLCKRNDSTQSQPNLKIKTMNRLESPYFFMRPTSHITKDQNATNPCSFT